MQRRELQKMMKIVHKCYQKRGHHRTHKLLVDALELARDHHDLIKEFKSKLPRIGFRRKNSKSHRSIVKYSNSILEIIIEDDRVIVQIVRPYPQLANALKHVHISNYDVDGLISRIERDSSLVKQRQSEFYNLLKDKFRKPHPHWHPTISLGGRIMSGDRHNYITVFNNGRINQWVVTISNYALQHEFQFNVETPRLHPPITSIKTVKSQNVIGDKVIIDMMPEIKPKEPVCLVHAGNYASVVIDDKVWLCHILSDVYYLNGVHFDLKLYDDEIKAIINVKD